MIDVSTPFDGDAGTTVLRRTFGNDGAAYAIPGPLLYFDSDGTRDGYARF